MYDEPPDPEPIPCPFCEAELGYGEGCEHCAMARKLGETESKLSELRHKLHCRASWICATDPQAVLSPRFMEAVGLVLDLAGLPLPEEFRRQALAAMTGEYGESRPYEASKTGIGLGSYVPAEELVQRKLRREALGDGDDAKVMRRLVGMLARRGYSQGMAFDVVKVALMGERERRRV